MNTLSIPETKVSLGREDLDELLTSANEIVKATAVIATAAECTTVREAMVEINTVVKDIEDQRVAAKAPFLATGKQIDALAKKLSAPFEKCVTMLKIRLADYAMKIEVERQQADMERLRREAENKAKAEAEGRVPELVTDLVPMDAADVATTTVLDYHVDMALLPKEYCIPDEPKIRAAVKAGIAIPGIRVEKRKQIVCK
jgi:molecular chaperone GrpE (heat shock protein)